MDRSFWRLFAAQAFAGADFIIRPNGHVGIAPQLTRTVATLAAAAAVNIWKRPIADVARL